MASEVASSSHSVKFYHDEGELLASLVKYIGTALRLGHDAVVIARPAVSQGLALELHREHVQRDPFGPRRGQLTTLDAQATLSTFMRDDWPDAALFDKHVADVIRRMTSGGKTAVAYGEMVALLCEQGLHAAALRLEQLWNALLARHSFSLLCAYPTRLFSNMTGKRNYQQICAAHSHVAEAAARQPA